MLESDFRIYFKSEFRWCVGVSVVGCHAPIGCCGWGPPAARVGISRPGLRLPRSKARIGHVWSRHRRLARVSAPPPQLFWLASIASAHPSSIPCTTRRSNHRRRAHRRSRGRSPLRCLPSLVSQHRRPHLLTHSVSLSRAGHCRSRCWARWPIPPSSLSVDCSATVYPCCHRRWGPRLSDRTLMCHRQAPPGAGPAPPACTASAIGLPCPLVWRERGPPACVVQVGHIPVRSWAAHWNRPDGLCYLFIFLLVQIAAKFKNLYKFDLNSENCEMNFIE
jgi:hypothetical protein